MVDKDESCPYYWHIYCSNSGNAGIGSLEYLRGLCFTRGLGYSVGEERLLWLLSLGMLGHTKSCIVAQNECAIRVKNKIRS